MHALFDLVLDFQLSGPSAGSTVGFLNLATEHALRPGRRDT